LSQTEKAAYWAELKAAGIQFPQHYRDYTTETLKEAAVKLREGLSQAGTVVPAETAPPPEAPRPTSPPPQLDPAAPKFGGEPDKMAGMRLNTHAEDEPLRVEASGRIVYQDEVRKAGSAQPRGRRVLKYTDPGFTSTTIKTGDFTETVEMPGVGVGRPAEARITMPSFQDAIYKDPQYPFKIHEYAGKRGFDLFEVRKFYGGDDLVPTDVETTYVGNTLCYDMRTTIRAIETEYREKMLRGEIKA